MTKKVQILNMAMKLISVKGFKDSTMTELARLSGVAHGTIFYHYANKEQLFLSILEQIQNEFTESFEQYLGKKDFQNGLEMMEGIVSFYLNLSSTMEDRFLLLHRHDAYELAQVNPVCRNHLESIYNCLVDIFEGAVSRGQSDGSIVVPAPPRKVALIIFAMVDALIRFNTYKLYEAGALYEELIRSIRKILKNKNGDEKSESTK